MIESIIKGKIEYEKKVWKNISDSAKDLVKKCLTLNPSKRITPDKALKHPWIVFLINYYGKLKKKVSKTKKNTKYWEVIKSNFMNNSKLYIKGKKGFIILFNSIN